MGKIKILEVLPCLTKSNGVAAYLSNFFINSIYKKNFDVFFLVFTQSVCDRHEEIINNGGHIVELYMEKNLIKYIKNIDDLLKKEKFDVIHCHAPNFGAIIMPIARKYKIPVRITHSHVNKSGETRIKNIRNYILSKICVKFSNKYLACSILAAEMLFKKKEYTIINNAIDVEKFTFSNNDRTKIRKELDIDDKFVIGEFGRLCSQKNQLFTLDIFAEYNNRNKNSVLLLAGDGPLESDIKDKVKRLGLEEKVLLLGSIKDIEKYYNALDFFLLPSNYEGLGIVLIEAQANGLHCLASDKVIPKEAKVSKLVEFVGLNEEPLVWSQKINKYDRENVKEDINVAGYNILTEADKLFYLYEKLYKSNKK